MPVSGVGCALSTNLLTINLLNARYRQVGYTQPYTTLPNSTMPYRCDCWNSYAMVCVSHRPLWICRLSTIVLSCTITKCKKGTNKEIRDMESSPRSTASDKLALTLTGSRADRQDTFKNPTYYHTKYYSNRLHNSGDIKVWNFAETLKYTHTVTSFYPVIVYEMTLTLTLTLTSDIK